MSFAVVELVPVPMSKEDKDNDAILNSMKRYEYKIHTSPRDTWQEANSDFQDFKFKNPTLVKLEVRSLEDLPKFIYL